MTALWGAVAAVVAVALFVAALNWRRDSEMAGMACGIKAGDRVRVAVDALGCPVWPPSTAYCVHDGEVVGTPVNGICEVRPDGADGWTVRAPANWLAKAHGEPNA